MKQVVNVYGKNQLSNIFTNHVDSLLSKTTQKYYSKIILHALHKLNRLY